MIFTPSSLTSMSRLGLLWIAFLLLQCAAQSQKSVPPGAVKIHYIARVPLAIMKHRPLNAITRFYGLTEVRGQKLALHFYDLEPTHKLSERHTKRNSRMDIFTVQRQGKKSLYKRIHNIALSRDFWADREQKIICEMLQCWLDPPRKTKPIIMLRVSSPLKARYFYDSLLTFGNGLKNKPSVNYFGGDFVDIGWSGWTTDYSKGLDRNGFLMPWQIDTQDSVTTYMVYKWNGQSFKEIVRQTDESTDSLTYHWDGEKFVEEDLNKAAR